MGCFATASTGSITSRYLASTGALYAARDGRQCRARLYRPSYLFVSLDARARFIALVWIILGLSICTSPVVLCLILMRYRSGLPLTLISTEIATGSALPVVLPSGSALLISAVVFGHSVFMAPGAVTNFTRQNLPPKSWSRTISLFTFVFAVAQTVAPYAARWLEICLTISGSAYWLPRVCC
ncbi:YbfB/YjiJ family MFS transporter [Pseudophaeobacter sp.]|uniref:YbfB/YjiJ family MFS transporter n=1 Tax=Pseudophaeobacter sp. TaxID=1971739 RepID=UPI00329741D5